MKINQLKTAAIIVTSLTALPFLGYAVDNPAQSHSHAHWGYEGENGPEHWADLDEANILCKTGKEQSPIDIKSSKVLKQDGLAFEYQPGLISFINNGHTVQANLKDKVNQIVLDGTTYTLLQFHLHTPSEETIDGKHSDMVIHFVHSTEDKTLAVVAVLFEVGDENLGLAPLLAVLPKNTGDEVLLSEPFDIKALLPADKDYYSFMGSLTTPPCSEGVHWQVLKQPVTLSQAQLDQIKMIVSGNARPTQPLNDRKVVEVDQN